MQPPTSIADHVTPGTPDRVPRASLRIQLTPSFDFAAAAARLDTIVALGVSHVYLSPIAEAVPGSVHGYDVTDHTSVRSELGGADGLDALLDAAHDRSLGIIIDHVPNHVSVERAEFNAPWWQTLRDGPSASSAKWFDIDWQAASGRVIIPQLGAPVDELLAAGQITTEVGDLGHELRVGTLRFPMAAGTEGLEVGHALDLQHYRLVHWRNPERNVRRFFTIDDLVAVRVEDREVAVAVDTIPRRLVDHPAFAGVRVDHVDGLAAPGVYLAGLRELIGDRLLFVEKIVAPGERLPRHWPVDGTTGYEQIAATEHALLDPAAEAPLMAMWCAATNDVSFADVERTARAEVLAGGLAPDFDRLAREVVDADGGQLMSTARRALDALTLSIERYRTYLPDDEMSDAVFEEVVEVASTGADERGYVDAATVRSVARVVRHGTTVLARWQQLTGPAVAKGGEDRAFYRWFPLASLCEVGGDPSRFSTPVSEFHEEQRKRQATHPASMLAATTHDTKRSAGVRARSLALASRAGEWSSLVAEWTTEHAALLHSVSGSASGGGLEQLALQTAVTAQPLDATRLGDYLVKAAREADLVTSWIDPDDGVESWLRNIAAQAVTDATSGSLAGFVQYVERAGDAVGLGLLAMQLTCPGFADLYQGAPKRLLTLVDPDNRMPVDWDDLERLVERVQHADTMSAFLDGNVDLARTILTQRLLHLRRRRPEAFGESAEYVELDVSGPGAEHVVAYARADEQSPLVAVVVVRALGSDAVLSDVEVDLPAGTWRSVTIDDATIEHGGRRRLTDLVDRPAGADGVPRFEVFDRVDR